MLRAFQRFSVTVGAVALALCGMSLVVGPKAYANQIASGSITTTTGGTWVCDCRYGGSSCGCITE